MTRFHFDFHSNDDVSIDEEGLELDDIEAARAEALASLNDFTRDLMRSELIYRQAAVVVRDGNGPVLSVTETFDVKNKLSVLNVFSHRREEET